VHSAAEQIVLTDVTSKTGITFRHTDGSSGRRYIMETVSAGLALFDYDNDEDIDIYFLNGAPLKGTETKTAPRNALYHNLGQWKFADVTERSGLGDTGYGLGVTAGDYDNDGDQDIYLNNYGPNVLYRNNGDGTFTDVSATAGIAAHAGWGMGMTRADYDNDGDTDIFIANDVAENFLFQNDGTGRFEELGLLAGTAYKVTGDPSGSMGVDSGDYDNDGLLDFFVTSYQQELALLYHNTDDGLFEDVTMRTGAGAGTLPNVTWGTGFVDFDNDGDRDIFIACGHLQDNVDQYDDVTSYHQTNILLANNGRGQFTNVSAQSGPGLRVKRSSRGAGFDDLDNDGDVDVVILNARAEPTLLCNDSPAPGHWLQIHLRGTKTNHDGVGARVIVKAGDLTLSDEVHSGRGYQSHYGTRLHFGLSQAKRVDQIEVRWIGGESDIFERVPTDQLITFVEDGLVEH
jgi:hypothetical protein